MIKWRYYISRFQGLVTTSAEYAGFLPIYVTRARNYLRSRQLPNTRPQRGKNGTGAFNRNRETYSSPTDGLLNWLTRDETRSTSTQFTELQRIFLELASKLDFPVFSADILHN